MNLLLVSSLLAFFEGKTMKYLIFLKFYIFLWKLGTKVNQCAFVSSVFDYFWIFGGPRKFWPKRRRRQVMPGGWIFRKWNHFNDKTTYWDAENDFCKKILGLLSCSCSSKLAQFREVWPIVDRTQIRCSGGFKIEPDAKVWTICPLESTQGGGAH